MKTTTILLCAVICTMIVFGQQSNPTDQAYRKRLDLKNGVSSLFAPEIYETMKGNLENDDEAVALLNQFPPFRHSVDTSLIGYIVTGEDLPDALLDLPLRVYGYRHSNYVTLRALSENRILVLDFWAKWCKPCVESMNHWDKAHHLYGDGIQFVGVNLDWDVVGIRSIERFGWKLPHIIGSGARILNRYLLGRVSYGPSAWIKDGKLFGISKANKVDDNDVMDILKGKIDVIPDHAIWQ